MFAWVKSNNEQNALLIWYVSTILYLETQEGIENILSWENAGGHKDHIHFENNLATIGYTKPDIVEEGILLKTSQPIPQILQSFHFEVELTKGGDSNDVNIGIKDNHPVVDSDAFVYNGNIGQIKNNGKLVAYAAPLETGDIIGCHVRKISAGEVTYRLCQFRRGSERIGPTVFLRENLRYPFIEFRSTVAEVVT